MQTRIIIGDSLKDSQNREINDKIVTVMNEKSIIITEIDVKTILHRNKPHFPWKWDLNLYRGCAHQCAYCFARQSHNDIESLPFIDEIFVKINAVELIEKTLSQRSWKGEMINIGSISDSFQPVEQKYRLTQRTLEVINRYPTPINITTKSATILENIDLIQAIAKKVPVQINSSMTTADEKLRKTLEPGASTTEERFNLLEKCKEAGCYTNLFIVPVIPFLTDNGKNIKKLLKQAAEVKVDGVMAWTLDLSTTTEHNYYKYLQKQAPELLQPTQELFNNPEKMNVYRRNVLQMISRQMHENNLTQPSHNFSYLGNTSSPAKQLLLFNQ